MNADYEIREIPMGYAPARERVEAFLAGRGLRLDKVDYYEAVYAHGEDEILAAGGLLKDTIRCIAVKEGLADEHLANSLVSHLMVIVQRRGYPTVKVFTRPGSKEVFRSLAFEVIAETESVLFMENSRVPLRNYLSGLERMRKPGQSGVIVMNCNPFTLGHRYLVEQASRQVDNLFVIPLLEEGFGFTYGERCEMIRLGTSDLSNVCVCEGSAYAISRATFPTYFLKQLDLAATHQMELDLQVFWRYVAPSLGATVRFVGSEPLDPLTCRYNELMMRVLPLHGIEVRQVGRLRKDGEVVSASHVRALIEANKMHAAMELVPPATRPFVLARFAVDALLRELDTTPKPGLVDKDNNGAHADMNYALMWRSIQALRPYFVRLAKLGMETERPPMADDVRRIGIEAERAMLENTGGVNTHRGALFSLGITVVAAAWLYGNKGVVTAEDLRKLISDIASGFEPARGTHGSEVVSKANVKGARENAVGGYAELFSTWMPLYRNLRDDRYRPHKTLLKIMSMLEDTNVYHRTDADTAATVRHTADMLLGRFSISALMEADAEFIRHNISPGGCADMLSLTMLVNAILK